MSCIRDNTPKDTEEARYIKSRGIHKTLKPCPFCGVNDAIKERISITGHSYVYHLFNGCVLGGKSFSSEEWDTRAYPKRLTVDELHEAIGKAQLEYSREMELETRYEKPADMLHHLITKNINNCMLGG